MKLRICDGERERIVPASLEMVALALAPGVTVRMGTEITLVDGGRWLAALAVDTVTPQTGEESEQFLLSGGSGGTAVVTGRLGRSEVLRRFRQFLQEGDGSEGR